MIINFHQGVEVGKNVSVVVIRGGIVAQEPAAHAKICSHSHGPEGADVGRADASLQSVLFHSQGRLVLTGDTQIYPGARCDIERDWMVTSELVIATKSVKGRLGDVA